MDASYKLLLLLLLLVLVLLLILKQLLLQWPSQASGLQLVTVASSMGSALQPWDARPVSISRSSNNSDKKNSTRWLRLDSWYWCSCCSTALSIGPPATSVERTWCSRAMSLQPSMPCNLNHRCCGALCHFRNINHKLAGLCAAQAWKATTSIHGRLRDSFDPLVRKEGCSRPCDSITSQPIRNLNRVLQTLVEGSCLV